MKSLLFFDCGKGRPCREIHNSTDVHYPDPDNETVCVHTEAVLVAHFSHNRPKNPLGKRRIALKVLRIIST